jgi:hypothetical protein
MSVRIYTAEEIAEMTDSEKTKAGKVVVEAMMVAIMSGQSTAELKAQLAMLTE